MDRFPKPETEPDFEIPGEHVDMLADLAKAVIALEDAADKFDSVTGNAGFAETWNDFTHDEIEHGLVAETLKTIADDISPDINWVLIMVSDEFDAIKKDLLSPRKRLQEAMT